MTKMIGRRQSHDCGRCGEELIAPDRCAFISEDRACHFWICSHCGYEFETFTDLKAPLLPVVIEPHLPVGLAA